MLKLPAFFVIGVTRFLVTVRAVPIEHLDLSTESPLIEFETQTPLGDNLAQTSSPQITTDVPFDLNDPCLREIPAIIAPVCGSDGNTYGNYDKLDAQRCRDKSDLTIEYEGPCGVGPAYYHGNDTDNVNEDVLYHNSDWWTSVTTTVVNTELGA